jgi:hypothetical protein
MELIKRYYEQQLKIFKIRSWGHILLFTLWLNYLQAIFFVIGTYHTSYSVQETCGCGCCAEEGSSGLLLPLKLNTGRRSSLPCPRPPSADISMFGLLYRNIGKDLSKLSMPINFNEPLSMLQVCREVLRITDL